MRSARKSAASVSAKTQIVQTVRRLYSKRDGATHQPNPKPNDPGRRRRFSV